MLFTDKSGGDPMFCIMERDSTRAAPAQAWVVVGVRLADLQGRRGRGGEVLLWLD
jgi:hypothetical protein